MAMYLCQSQLAIEFLFLKNMQTSRESLSCCNITNTFGLSVLTLKWFVSFLVSNADTPSYLSMWNSRARERHWVESNWPPRSDLKPGDPNILHEPLVDRILYSRLCT
uniref:Uncharacterized protein n=1 Tax=Pyxicephalus adspersus TaxID=30357 RepID=A0AAV2ZX45_PYXAD|nr:TPA: hypothetical protein GDO54_018032 [Pyxicephalus adspersus]